MGINEQLKMSNFKKNIKIRAQQNKGYISLYLDYTKNKKRHTKFLKIYLTGKKKDDNEKLKLAINIREKLEIELLKDPSAFQLNRAAAQASFISFFETTGIGKKSTPYENTIKKLKEFSEFIPMNADSDLWEDFYNFLLSKVSKNSAALYFSKIRTAYNLAIRKKIVLTNPTRTVIIKKEETEREFLEIDELKKLMKTPCLSSAVKNAFIFSCFTGLRLSDVKSIKNGDINGVHLRRRQQKTKDFVTMKLAVEAKKAIEAQVSVNEKDFVFPLPESTHLGYVINKWVLAAEINKHITFHCARHTFATMLLTQGVGIFTVSKLLGHKDLASTLVYAKLVSKKKDEAIDKLPVFN